MADDELAPTLGCPTPKLGADASGRSISSFQNLSEVSSDIPGWSLAPGTPGDRLVLDIGVPNNVDDCRDEPGEVTVVVEDWSGTAATEFYSQKRTMARGRCFSLGALTTTGFSQDLGAGTGNPLNVVWESFVRVSSLMRRAFS